MKDNNLIERPYNPLTDTKFIIAGLAGMGLVLLVNSEIGREIVCSGLEKIQYSCAYAKEMFNQVCNYSP